MSIRFLSQTTIFSVEKVAIAGSFRTIRPVQKKKNLQELERSFLAHVLWSLSVAFSHQSGKLQIFELASGSLLETVDAHDGALWSLCLAPDQVNLTAFDHLSCLQSHLQTERVQTHHILAPLYLVFFFWLIVCVIPVEGDCDRKCRQDSEVLGVWADQGPGDWPEVSHHLVPPC